jgi:hypothetical protein
VLSHRPSCRAVTLNGNSNEPLLRVRGNRPTTVELVLVRFPIPSAARPTFTRPSATDTFTTNCPA